MIHIYMERCETNHGKKKRDLEQQIGTKLLYKGLNHVFDMAPDDAHPLVFLKGEHGKPYLKDYPHIHYNISHTDDLIVCGIGSQEIGIDVEKIRPFYKNIVKKVFSETERKHLEALPEEAYAEYFFRIWTLKESYVKAIGCGITVPLKDISFEWKENVIIVSSRPDMFFYQKIIENRYVLSVCAFEEENIHFAKNFLSCYNDEKKLHDK
jgi:4'-phosphopantetheinyl transferase